MDKQPSTAPPRHRRYPRHTTPRAEPPPPPAEERAIARRWPRPVPERRVFPRG